MRAIWRRTITFRFSLFVAALGLLLPQACSSSKSDGTLKTVPDAGNDAGLPFGAECTDTSECTEGICFLYGDGTMHCTVPCTTADTCPNGTMGKKCNGKGYCAP